ncbi:MAG: XRE family transcriptional regulator [Bacillota bacterium]|nr:XRE family transcriptional regulator [Bacillota bacterium]
MKNLSPVIGRKLKELRIKKNLSLDDTAKLTGVSKAMLGQMERGESNPTVSTLWKIATGLKVSFSSFIDEFEDNAEIICQDDIDPVIEDNNRMRLYPIFSFNPRSGFEIFTIELEPSCNHISSPHDEGVEEYIIVTEGELELTLNDKTYTLTKGNSIKFKGDSPHAYRNTSTARATFQNIILYIK